VPKKIGVVTREQLESLANPIEEPKRGPGNSGSGINPDRVAQFLTWGTLEIKDVKDLPGGERQWILRRCPFNVEHKDAAVFWHPTGLLTFNCFHASCKEHEYTWHDFVRTVEDTRGGTFNFWAAGVQCEATPDGIVWHKQTQNGETIVPLTNFTARIVADIEEDDGSSEPKHVLEMEATLKGRPRRFSVPAAQFKAMDDARRDHRGHVQCPGNACIPMNAKRTLRPHTG
jgi:hypothetical protein